MLLEVLIAILVFSIGVLGMLGLLGIAVKSSSDAKYRADASYLATQIISRMWVDMPNVGSYAHNAAAAVCGAGNTPSGYAAVGNWLTDVAAALPGADANRQRIQVDAVTGQVSVTVCWRSPQEPAGQYHNFIATGQVSG